MVSILTLSVLSIKILRRRLYDAFIKVHKLLALTVVTALGFHLRNKTTWPLILSIYILWTLDIVARIFISIYRSYKYTWSRGFEGFQKGYIKDDVCNGMHIIIDVAKSWDFKAGQTVYITIPTVSFWAFTKSHPFTIVWWTCQKDGSATIEILVEKKKGFTRRLASLNINMVKFNVLVEGPYGYEKNISSYSNVLLFGTNFGIAAQIPYLRRLIEGYKQLKIMTRRVRVFWEVDQSAVTAVERCLSIWMNKLFAMDDSLVSLLSKTNDLPDSIYKTNHSLGSLAEIAVSDEEEIAIEKQAVSFIR